MLDKKVVDETAVDETPKKLIRRNDIRWNGIRPKIWLAILLNAKDGIKFPEGDSSSKF